MIVTRGWHADVYVDPHAQSPDAGWHAKLDASLPGRETDFRLCVPAGDDWHGSPHRSAAELRAELAGWIRLSCPRFGRTWRLWPGAAPEGGGLPDAIGRRRWLEPLLATLPGAAIASAEELLEMARRHIDACESLTVTFGPPSPAGPPQIEALDHHFPGPGVPGLTPHILYPWLLETELTGRVVVAAESADGVSWRPRIVVLPTVLKAAEQTPAKGIAAIRVRDTGNTCE